MVTGPFLPNGRYGEAMRIGGDVSIRGDLVVGGAKSAVLARDGGPGPRVYCVEAAEAWIEDIGEADLEDGRAVVAIDPDLRPFLQTDGYQVAAHRLRAGGPLRRPPRPGGVRGALGGREGHGTVRVAAQRPVAPTSTRPAWPPSSPSSSPSVAPPPRRGRAPETPARALRPKAPARVREAVAAPPAPEITLPRRRRMPKAATSPGT